MPNTCNKARLPALIEYEGEWYDMNILHGREPHVTSEYLWREKPQRQELWETGMRHCYGLIAVKGTATGALGDRHAPLLRFDRRDQTREHAASWQKLDETLEKLAVPQFWQLQAARAARAAVALKAVGYANN